MMCLCENNQIESWQIQMGENETLRFFWLHIVGSTQHCRNCNFFRNVLFCSFEFIKHIYIICENVLNVLLIFLQ